MGVMKNWNLNVALNCFNDFGQQFGVQNYNCAVAATTDTTLTVPNFTGLGKANDQNPKIFAVFGYAGSVTMYVANNATALPTLAGSFTLDNSVINPSCREVKGGDVLHFYSVAGGNMTVAFYAI